MKSWSTPQWLMTIVVIILFSSTLVYFYQQLEVLNNPPNYYSSETESAPPSKDYFKKKYANPETGEVGKPSPKAQQYWLEMIESQKSQNARVEEEIEWVEVGPTNVGGRTRAIAIDSQNPNRLIAGGVRGGFWVTENNGERWEHVKGITENESITYLVQHPNQPNNWYASTGELDGSGANFFGGGLLYSLDNGSNWDAQHYKYQFDENKNEYIYKSISGRSISSPSELVGEEGYPFEYSSKILVHPDSNSIFVATHGWGILKSTDNIQSFTHSLPSNPKTFPRQVLEADSSTTLLLRFEDNLNGEQGETIINNPTLEYEEGVHGKAGFLGAGDQLEYAVENNINSQEGTIEFWIKPKWSGNDGGENDFLLFGDIPGAIFIHRVFGYVEIIVNLGGEEPTWQIGANTGNTTWLANEWHHLAFTWSAEKIQTYIDGDLLAEAAVTYPLPELSTTQFKIGNSEVPAEAFIDEFRISNRARTAEEINQSFQFGSMQESQAVYPNIRPKYSDISVGPDGDLMAYLSGTRSAGSGVYRSVDNGTTWKDITPTDWPEQVDRGIIEHAPSNPDVAYLLLIQPDGELTFYKFDLESEIFENRTQGLPEGDIFPGNYNLVMDVKPDDENFIVIGGISLARTFDGFTVPSDNFTLHYIQNNMHVDNHLIYFDPNNPDAAWAVNDGGIYYTDDITRITNSFDNVIWQDKDNNYNVTQFYTVGQSNDPTDHRVVGGAQDNGYLQVAPPDPKETWRAFGDEFGSDGADVYVTRDFTYMSFQFGETYRLTRGPDGNAEFPFGFIGISPPGAPGRDFIHRWAVDPVEENTMYYPINNKVYRIDSIDQTPIGTFYGEENYDLISDGDLEGHGRVTALAVTTEPAHTLLYAATGEKPIIKRLKNAHTDSSVVEDVSIKNALVSWTNTRCIAPNPVDGDEWLVVITNYDVPSLYHTQDGGKTYNLVEGNLAGIEGIPGPTMEWAEILNFEGQKYYFLATHIGVFMTKELNGDNTIWTHQGTDVLGYSLALMVQARESDGKIVVGTHGRGFFAGFLSGVLASDAKLFSFSFTDPIAIIETTVDSVAQTIAYTVERGTDISNLTPQITISEGATINPGLGEPQDFTNPVKYTITSEDGATTATWTVSVSVQLSSLAELLNFTIDGIVITDSQADSIERIIEFTVQAETDITSLTPTIEISEGATISPGSNEPQNFSNPVEYTITSEDGTVSIVWTVMINVEQTITSIDNELENEFLSIYPNPVNSKLNIDFKTNNFSDIEIELYNISGKKLLSTDVGQSQKSVAIDVSKLIKGIYVLKVYNQGKLISFKKIIIN